jgi:hypothetical protein
MTKLKTGYNTTRMWLHYYWQGRIGSSSHTSLINNLGWLKKETSESPHKINMQTSRGKGNKNNNKKLSKTHHDEGGGNGEIGICNVQTCVCSLSSNSTRSFPIPRTTMYGVKSQSYCTIRWATTSHNNYQLLQQIGKETKLPKLIEEREPIWEKKKERKKERMWLMQLASRPSPAKFL